MFPFINGSSCMFRQSITSKLPGWCPGSQEIRFPDNVGVSHQCPFPLSSVNFVANKMLFIPCFLSYLILHFRTYHCLGSKETTTWTTYVYSYCSVLCRESCRPCRWAVRLRGGVGPGFHGKYFADTNLWFYWFIFCLSHCIEVCNIMLHGTTL